MQVTKSERPHIAFFGSRNAGKSSLVNAIANQNLAVVSDIKGTTTDPVEKAMEILPIGPVVIIDTAGFDDAGEIGNLRIEKTMRVMDKTDLAVLVIDSTVGVGDKDWELIKTFYERKIKFMIAFNKCDLNYCHLPQGEFVKTVCVSVSGKTGQGLDELKESIANLINKNKKEKYIIRDRLKQGDVVVLVIPIDESAPKGRIILPQQNVLRECLDSHSTAICCQVEELEELLKKVTPKFVITDSQAFNKVKDIVPENIILTSFSILMANYRGKLESLLDGAEKISHLNNGDTVLISEGCTHHRQCNDIGTVKFPKWIKDFTQKDVNFEFTQGGEFPEDLSKYKLIIHCGGCMINESEMKSRQKRALEQNIPMVNYGMAIAYMNGILGRALRVFDNE